MQAWSFEECWTRGLGHVDGKHTWILSSRFPTYMAWCGSTFFRYFISSFGAVAFFAEVTTRIGSLEATSYTATNRCGLCTHPLHSDRTALGAREDSAGHKPPPL